MTVLMVASWLEVALMAALMVASCMRMDCFNDSLIGS